MKKYLLLFIFFTCFTTPIIAQRQISSLQAKKAAIKVAKSLSNNGDSVIQRTHFMINNIGDTLMYEIRMRDNITILLSGCTTCPPVLGTFLNKTEYSLLYDIDSFPLPMKQFLNGYLGYLDFAFANNQENVGSNQDWDSLLSSIQTTRTHDYLISTSWGPNKSNDNIDENAYNCYTPIIGNCQSSAGSAAVAMAQLINYWKYPNFMTSGSDIFDWCNMSDMLITESDCYDNNKKAIGMLIATCGAAANVSYGCNYSETSKDSVKTTLQNYFYYKTNGFIRPPLPGNPDPQQEAWELLLFENDLKHEIDAGRPMIGYSTCNNKKYFFICDGYDNSNPTKFHFNFGSNSVGDLFLTVRHIFFNNNDLSLNLEILTGIKPKVILNTHEDTLKLTEHYNLFLSQIGSVPCTKFVPYTSNVLISADSSSSYLWRTIRSGENSIYQACEEIILQPGFKAESGCNFTARIEPCESCEQQMVTLSFAGNETSQELFDATAIESQTIMIGDTAFAIKPSRLSLFPNPAENILTIVSPDEIKDVNIFDQMGKQVFRWFVTKRSDDSISINVADISHGTYIVRIITCDGNIHIGRFVKK